MLTYKQLKRLTFPAVLIPEYQPFQHSLLKRGKLTYVAGFVAKKVLTHIKLC